MVIANTWQPLGASRQLTLRHSAASILCTTQESCNNNRYDCARRSFQNLYRSGLAYPRLPGVRPLMQAATVKPAFWQSGLVVRGTCGEPHTRRKGSGLLLVTPSYICHLYPLDTSIVSCQIIHRTRKGKKISCQLLYHDVSLLSNRGAPLRCNRSLILPSCFSYCNWLTAGSPGVHFLLHCP